MGTNINNYNLNNLRLSLNFKEYWDFFLADGAVISSPFTGSISGTCFVTHFDFNDSDIYSTGSTSANTIYSLQTWTGATNTGYTLDTIGLTGIDNGLVAFDKISGDTTNQALLSALTTSILTIPSGDTRFILNRVTGTTEQYVYPMEIISDTGTTGNYARLCGGFYQGYYKLDGYDYQVLPNRMPRGWVSELWLNKSDDVCSGTTGTTLNDNYPNNKGFFFYMGTRAENKFWTVFEGLDTGCTVDCTIPVGCTGTPTEWCTVPKENQIVLADGHPLSPPLIKFLTITNGFMIYNQGEARHTHYGIGYPKGKETPWRGSVVWTATTMEQSDFRNPFMVYWNSHSNLSTCSNEDSPIGGSMVSDYTGATRPDLILDVNADIVDNAIGFRIKDDGSIGYRLLSMTGACSGDTYYSGITVTEKYSASGTVSGNVWTNVSVRFYAYETYNEYQLTCGDRRLGWLGIYVDGKLKLWVDDFLEIVPRRLNDDKNKQLAVPYNISVGGGSQGLLETMTFDGQDPSDLGLNIEQNFAGTFVGDISQFKFYACDLDWTEIENNYNQELSRYR
tara:strand:- start:259 stop:1944 length:1686 start_codon:yes stop_codon:yes gene_type:complete